MRTGPIQSSTHVAPASRLNETRTSSPSNRSRHHPVGPAPVADETPEPEEELEEEELDDAPGPSLPVTSLP